MDASNSLADYFAEGKRTLVIGAPFILNQLLQMSIVTIDSIMASSDGKLTLAAVAQGIILWDVVALIIIGICMTLTPMIAKTHAKGNTEQLRHLFQQNVWTALIVGIVGMILIWYMPWLMVWVGVQSIIIAPATDYLRVMAIGIPFLALMLPTRFFNEGIENAKIVMLITALSIPINIIGNYIFIHGLFGFPKMGAAGIALSSVISIVIVFFVSWGYLLSSQKTRHYRLMQAFSRPALLTIQRFFSLGLPNAVALLLEVGMFAFVVMLSGRMGVTTAAANQIAFNYASLVFMIPLGISMALTARIGRAMAHNDLAKARVIGLSGMGLGALFMVFSILNIVLFGENIARLYSHDTAVLTLAVGLLTIAAIFQIPDAIQVCGAGALRGLEQTKAPMHYAIIGYWLIGMPVALLLAFTLDKGAYGLWLGLAIGLTITATLEARKFIHLTRPQILPTH
ncbi:MATE family efflux transporter [Ostreibacterium oceani]|uniref:Multidrug-efflux transporter n=1 Tax=Ostreibacterium oceani TaxID=2654998 RepID=A0A6N7EW74_9GAMM|nr:MATE family efflux transporter [Ostreibacterium oceani]MPV86801.1 MATE family efflux transporter [Ostreibacterium oceani]